MPDIGAEIPSIPFEKEAKREKDLFAACSHFGQVAPSLLLLTGRSNSNLQSQLGQKYSYIGIVSLRYYCNLKLLFWSSLRMFFIYLRQKSVVVAEVRLYNTSNQHIKGG